MSFTAVYTQPQCIQRSNFKILGQKTVTALN